MDNYIVNVENDLKGLMQIYRDKIKDVDRDISMWEKDLNERDITEKEVEEIKALIQKKHGRRDDYVRIINSLEYACRCIDGTELRVKALQTEKEMLTETVRQNVQKIEQYMKGCSDCMASLKIRV